MSVPSGNDGYDFGSPLARSEPMLWKLTVALLTATVALFYFRPFDEAQAESARPLVLRATDENSRLLLRWDPALRDVREAESAKVEVVDGGSRFEFPLQRDTLLAGSFEYARRSDDVAATLRLFQGGRESKFAVVRSFGQPEVQPPPEPARRVEQVRNRLTETRAKKHSSVKKRVRGRR